MFWSFWSHDFPHAKSYLFVWVNPNLEQSFPLHKMLTQMEGVPVILPLKSVEMLLVAKGPY